MNPLPSLSTAHWTRPAGLQAGGEGTPTLHPTPAGTCPSSRRSETLYHLSSNTLGITAGGGSARSTGDWAWASGSAVQDSCSAPGNRVGSGKMDLAARTPDRPSLIHLLPTDPRRQWDCQSISQVRTPRPGPWAVAWGAGCTHPGSDPARVHQGGLPVTGKCPTLPHAPNPWVDPSTGIPGMSMFTSLLHIPEAPPTPSARAWFPAEDSLE